MAPSTGAHNSGISRISAPTISTSLVITLSPLSRVTMANQAQTRPSATKPIDSMMSQAPASGMFSPSRSANVPTSTRKKAKSHAAPYWASRRLKTSKFSMPAPVVAPPKDAPPAAGRR